MTCNRENCTKEAKWSPVVLLWASKKFGPHDPIRVAIGLELCDDHRPLFSIDDLSPTFIELINDTAAATGKAKPDMTRTQIEFLPCAEVQAQIFGASQQGPVN